MDTTFAMTDSDTRTWIADRLHSAPRLRTRRSPWAIFTARAGR